MEVIAARPKSLTTTPFTYCPGCLHGVAHRLIAEAIEELGLTNKMSGVAPVGCSVFAYKFFNFDMAQAAHGRAPAVATGMKRARPDMHVFTYQGDGDLAAIGTAEIVHAANRGEHFSVFFVNNAIYGMTGGQMAPTTLPNMKTTTSPYGRNTDDIGFPIRVAELLDTLIAPYYIERVSLLSSADIIKAKKAVLKALTYNKEGKGFTFVEIISTCPTNWGLDPMKSKEWAKNEMLPFFKLGLLRDKGAEGQSMKYEMICAGFGGQGVLTIGKFIAAAGMKEGRNVSWLPSYGPEMRGGTANVMTVVADDPIASPIVSYPDILIALNQPSLDKFGASVRKGGVVIINTDMCPHGIKRDDVVIIAAPMSTIAKEIGSMMVLNMVAIGMVIGKTGIIKYQTMEDDLTSYMKAKNPELLEMNLAAIRQGMELAK